jgi:hypothetical protein
MGDHFSEDVNQMLEESLSQINSSLKHLTNTVRILEKVVREQDCFSQFDIFLVERDIESQGHSITELKRMMERKRMVFKIIKK